MVISYLLSVETVSATVVAGDNMGDGEGRAEGADVMVSPIILILIAHSRRMGSHRSKTVDPTIAM